MPQPISITSWISARHFTKAAASGSILKHLAPGGSLLLSVDYGYDVIGYLLTRIETVSSVDTEVRFTYEIDDRTPATTKVVSHLWAELDDTGTVTTRYFLGDGETEKLARSDSSGNVWLMGDRQGNISEVLDDTGSLGREMSYDSFGNMTSNTGTLDAGRFLYAGYLWDATVSQYATHWRWYDPANGQWTTEDPIRFDAQDPNLRRYVSNDGANGTDRSGLFWFTDRPNESGTYEQLLVNNGIRKWWYSPKQHVFAWWIHPDDHEKFYQIWIKLGYNGAFAAQMVEAAITKKSTAHISIGGPPESLEYSTHNKNATKSVKDAIENYENPKIHGIFPATPGFVSEPIDNKERQLLGGIVDPPTRDKLYSKCEAQSTIELPTGTIVNNNGTNVAAGTHKFFGPLQAGQYAGTKGAAPCIGVIVRYKESTAVFHFYPKDDAPGTLAQYRWPTGSKAIVFGGNDESLSRWQLMPTLQYLRVNGFQITTVPTATSLLIDKDSNVFTLPKSQ